MIKDTEKAPEPGSTSSSSTPGTPRKPYESPRLLEWGSILELTGGPLADVQDDDFSGSGAV